MVEPIANLDSALIARRLAAIRDRAGPEVEILVATKYVRVEDMGALAEAGVSLVGENRLQDLVAKQERWGDRFVWDFIGNLQSRKAREVYARSRLVHSLASESALAKLAGGEEPSRGVLVQVNLSGEESKGGVAPAALAELIAASPVPVTGLSTMPPLSHDPEASRPCFAELAELAAEHRLTRLSMGTSQDWEVALSEGATTIRLGSSLLR